jgi:hypothetical protein
MGFLARGSSAAEIPPAQECQEDHDDAPDNSARDRGGIAVVLWYDAERKREYGEAQRSTEGTDFGGPVGDWLGVDEVEDDVGAGGLDTGALELVPLAPLAEAPLAEGPLAEGPLTEDAAAEISRLAWAKT